MIKPIFLTIAMTGALQVGEIAPTLETFHPQAAAAAESPQASQTLRTYDGPAQQIPVKAQYPDIMEVSGTSSGEGVGVFFTFQPQGNALDSAAVHLFLPAGTATAADQEPLVTGPNGLMKSNGWLTNSIQRDGSADFPYPWVETVINFSIDQEQSGQILLGQIHGQAVQITLLYPAEMASAYWPAARTILDSLEFDPGLLPIHGSGL
jgi:hypothetical protein